MSGRLEWQAWRGVMLLWEREQLRRDEPAKLAAWIVRASPEDALALEVTS